MQVDYHVKGDKVQPKVMSMHSFKVLHTGIDGTKRSDIFGLFQ